MKFTSIYKNGRPDYFFIALDASKHEFNFVQPYYIVTNIDHPRHGRIREMNALISIGETQIQYGKGTHGYGYSFSADIYGELIDIIRKLYKNDLTESELEELRKINTHDDDLELSEGLIAHLGELNEKAIEAKFKNL